jgi:hypothetical protein
VPQIYSLPGTAPQTQITTGAGNTVQTLTLQPRCSALILSGQGSGTNVAFVTFDNSTPSSSNGQVIVATGQPVTLPIGYYSHASHAVKVIGSAANTLLNVTQLVV